MIRDKCLDCHTEIRRLIENDRGLHALNGAEDCASCHPDHAGQAFDLIFWEEGRPEDFDHTRAGWPLEGAHTELDCAKCHTPTLQDSAFMSSAQTKSPEASFLGLRNLCASCHGNVHGTEKMADCASCHRTDNWKNAPGFDHGKTDFALTGRHVDTDCAKCHGPLLSATMNLVQPGPAPSYALDHGECSACHKDHHEGRFGSACGSCHRTSSFKDIKQDTFDHDRTRYPLTGAHGTIPCARCHDPVQAWGEKPPFETCSSCHVDAHAGSVTQVASGVDCAACHQTTAFKPASFTGADHERTDFPLAGKHAQVSCAKCHGGADPGMFGSAGVRLSPTFEQCSDCHENVHGAQEFRSLIEPRCGMCHHEEGFAPATFSSAEHRELRLPLEGAHAELRCRECHDANLAFLNLDPSPERFGSANFVFAVSRTQCVDCHGDIHAGTLVTGTSCAQCHETRSFKPSAINNDSHLPPLNGAHKAVPCFECHEGLIHEPVVTSLRPLPDEGPLIAFRLEPRACRDCHETPHGEQLSFECSTCHTEVRFSPAERFNHETQSRFPLKGAHERVPCADCHRGRDEENRVIYKPLEMACSSCHRDGREYRP